ncbi:MAG: tRNA (adenosine(37)-N6)-dimethylallyltransferase MiaA [Ferruginibacter sp.]
MLKTVIIIAGPTAVGKTDVAFALAKHFSTQIISADSRQCYKELDIGVAKPSPIQLDMVRHYFVNSHSIQDKVTAAMFEDYALKSVAQIFATNDVAIVTGGTGLYLNAFCNGLDAIPSIKPSLRQEQLLAYQTNGIGWLQNEIKINDPLYAEKGNNENPQRMLRALEVVMTTGRSILSFHSNKKNIRDFNIIKIALHLPRPVLYAKINQRVDAMMDAGLAQEVAALLPFRHLNALQTVGYKELFAMLNGGIDLPAAIGLIKQNTRHYSKRQITWFNNEGGYQNISPSEIKALLGYIYLQLKL